MSRKLLTDGKSGTVPSQENTEMFREAVNEIKAEDVDVNPKMTLRLRQPTTTISLFPCEASMAAAQRFNLFPLQAFLPHLPVSPSKLTRK
ncbi:hypothetical protein Bca52824_073245 [Brassica carinata]|uniref:Uncharacterized protein n=1 Tax=Brassica carinata TaxID=52824 RepID=A0A8X7U7R0_BRACI|nr:hypothetical protein Bca52824_073245 [Brassica carinata]